uniref:Uncharacterized protein n=1 Tax=Strongyloides venezuelensis TaxID=75913 RepID=A0A0K0FT07_STRVS
MPKKIQVSILSEEQNKILSDLNTKFEENFNIVFEKLTSKNKVFTKTGEVAIKNELIRYRILRDRMNNCSNNINMLVSDLKHCMEFEDL